MESPIEQNQEGTFENADLKHADSDSVSVNSIPPPPPPMGMVVPVASEESMDITEAERLRQHQEEQQIMEEEERQRELEQQQLHQHQQLQEQQQPLAQEHEPVESPQDFPPQMHQEKPQGLHGHSDNCCEKILKCMSLIPCPSLLSWIVLLMGVGCLTGSLLVATWRTRDLLDEDKLLWFMEYTVIGISVGMFLVGTLLLIAGHLSSEPNSRRVFNSFSKNKCAQGLNIFALIVCYILAIIWTLAAAILAVPLVFLVNIFIQDRDSFNPDMYGFKSHEYTGAELISFEEKAKNLLITYGIVFGSAILLVNSMICFIICTSSNIAHLRDNRFATLNAYNEDVHNSKHSVLDTNM